MDDSQLEPPAPLENAPEHEGLSPLELAEERKKEIAASLRGLVQHPGWLYLCGVIKTEALRVRSELAEAASLDGLLRINSELREIATYEYLLSLPAMIISDFEVSHDDSE